MSTPCLTEGRIAQQHLHIDVGHAADEELKLTLIEHVDKVARDQFEQAVHERVELLLDTPGDTILHNEVNVFFLVLLSDINVFTPRFELNGHHLSESLFGDGEGLVKYVRNVVFPVTQDIVSYDITKTIWCTLTTST